MIVERILKCNHPRLGEGNRERLQSLFTFLLQHVHDCAVDYGTAENGEYIEKKKLQIPNGDDTIHLVRWVPGSS